MTGPKLLLVDDEANILSSLRRLLIPNNFDVTITESPFEALHLVSKEEFAIVMSDHRMPHMEGTVLLKKIKEISPASIRILLTGYADLNAATSAINEGEVYRFLAKPWDDETLLNLLKEAQAEFERNREQKDAHKRNSELKELNKNLTERNVNQVVQNRHLIRELDHSYALSIKAMASPMKLYDARLWHQALSAKLICQGLTKALSLPPQQATQLETAGFLHEIGKVGLPHSILKKPESAMTAQEKDLYQEYPFNGATIVGLLPHFQEAALLIRYHREHFDGAGYPDGLKGEQIPAGSRLIAVVDAYVKLKKGHPLTIDDAAHQALAALENQSGKQFDPEAIALLQKFLLVDKASNNPLSLDMIKPWQASMAAYATDFPSAEADPKNEASQGNAAKTHVQDDRLAPPNKVAAKVNEAAGKTNFFDFEELPETLPSWGSEEEWAAKTSETSFVPCSELLTAEEKTMLTAPANARALVETSVVAAQDETQPAKPAMPHPSTELSHAIGAYLSQTPRQGGTKNVYKQAAAPTPQQYREVSITSAVLCAGMVLSRNLVSPQGVKLLEQGSVIHPDQLHGLKSYLTRNGLQDLEIHVLKPVSIR
jgi:response regulator RpfG family c-di-GMP phosphodiesterase